MSRFFLGLVAGVIGAYTALTLYGRIPHADRARSQQYVAEPWTPAQRRALGAIIGNHRMTNEDAGTRIKRSGA